MVVRTGNVLYWGNDIEYDAILQAGKTSRLPFIEGHKGYHGKPGSVPTVFGSYPPPKGNKWRLKQYATSSTPVSARTSAFKLTVRSKPVAVTPAQRRRLKHHQHASNTGG